MRPAIFLAAALLTACAPHKAAVKAPVLIDNPTWTAIENPPGHFLVLLRTAKAEEEALKSICDPHKFYCIGPEKLNVIQIERKRK
jgi:hypothetical protein